MLLRVPVFYDSFHCIADKCTDSCCVGWEIDIDDKSVKHYTKIKGDFGKKLHENIENGHFKLCEGDRCPFLKQNGLCEMICNLGEDNLCDICREHPRFVEVYGDIMEKGIGLCCEEGVKLLLNANGTSESSIAFIEREINDNPDEIPNDAIKARNAIFKEREHLYKILTNHNKSLNERLIELLDYAVETCGFEHLEQNLKNISTNKEISNNVLQSWIDVLGKGESYGPAWDKAYSLLKKSNLSHPINIFSDCDGEKIIAYLLFRYYAKSLFDGNSLTKVEFALYFWIMLRKFGSIFANATGNTPTAKIAAIKLFSKQTEYSEEIMRILEEEFMENPLFSPKNFKRILVERM